MLDRSNETQNTLPTSLSCNPFLCVCIFYDEDKKNITIVIFFYQKPLNTIIQNEMIKFLFIIGVDNILKRLVRKCYSGVCKKKKNQVDQFVLLLLSSIFSLEKLP